MYTFSFTIDLDQPLKEMINRAMTESDNIIAADSTDIQLTTDPIIVNSYKRTCIYSMTNSFIVVDTSYHHAT